MTGLIRPYYRTARPIVDGNYFYGAGGVATYIKHPEFSKEPQNYMRAFLL
jgi:hypothetical protein